VIERAETNGTVRNHGPAEASRRLEAALLASLDGPTADETPLAVVASVAALAHRYTGEPAIALTLTWRDSAAARVDLDLGDNPTFAELVERARRALGASGVPASVAPGAAGGRVLELRHRDHRLPFGTDASGAENYERELRVQLDDGRDGPTGEVRLGCGADGADPAAVARVLDHLLVLVEGAAADRGRRVGDLPLLGPDERRLVVETWNGTHRAYPDRVCVHELIEQQVARDPEAVALVFNGQSLTYRELDQRANQLAHHLRDLGIGPNVPVGISIERSLELVVGLLGILKAGGAYVPLDPDYPAERLAFMLDDARITVVLTREMLAGPVRARGLQALCLDTAWPVIATKPDTTPARLAGPDDLAYVIYTSGSTGNPKGAMNAHRAVVNRLLWMQDEYRLGPDDRVLQKTPASFDVSVWEFFWPLLVGARLVIARPGGHRDATYLARLIREAGITTIHFVPSMLQIFLAEPGIAACTSLRRVFASGEALPFELQERFFERLGAELHNLYGPTEAAVDVTYWPCARGRGGAVVPIGRPIANTRIYILDAYGHPVPVGVAGEIYIGGVAVGQGYLNRPELTAEKFVADHVSPEPGGRLYRTGDRGRHRADGVIEYLGRLDNQVKIRGFRVELGEIEARIGQHPGVRETAVVARPFGPGDTRLVAYLVPSSSDILSVHGIRRHLAERLPEHMVPTSYVTLPAMPLTPSGKIDRKALPAPDDHRLAIDERYVGPRTPTEALLAMVWSQVLRAPRVSVDDNFFELGGESILALQIVARARDLGIPISVQQIFEHQTVAALAAAVAAPPAPPASPAPPAAPAPPAFPRAGLPPEIVTALTDGRCIEDLFGLAPIQEGMLFHTLDAPASGVYVEQVVLTHGPDLDVDAFEGAWRRAVDRHASLRTSFHWEGLPHPVQAVHRQVSLPVTRHDWSALPAHEATERLRALLAEDEKRGFDVAEPPLVRLALVRTAASWELVWTFHHLVLDGWSVALLLREVLADYAAGDRGTPLSPPPTSYRDFVEWIGRRDLAQAEQFWRAELSGVSGPTPLVVDTPACEAPGHEGYDCEEVELDMVRTAQLRALCRKERLTLSTVAHGAWALLLARYSGEEEVLFGSAVAGRPADLAGVEHVVGCFINTLPARVRVPETAGLVGWLREIQARQTRLQPFESTPLRRIHDWSSVAPDVPLFESVVLFQNQSLDLAGGGRDTGWQRSRLRVPERTNYPLVAEFIPGSGRLTLRLSYDRRRLHPDVVTRMAGHMLTFLTAMAAGGERRLETLPLLEEQERHQLLVDWNETARPYDTEACVHHLIQAQARRTPDAVAVVFGQARQTYRELDERANQVAHRLRALGVQPGALVGVAMERSLELPAALLGVLKAGGAYVPLDPGYPHRRLEFMMSDANIRVLLTQSRVAGRLPATGAPTILLDGFGAVGAEPREPVTARATATDLAYVIYTSGSTGRPKGVTLSHGNVVNFFGGMEDRIGAGEPGVWLAVTSIAFDISVLELLWPLTRGYCVVVHPELARAVAAAGPRPAPLDFSLFYFANDDDRPGDKYRLLVEGAKFADRRGFTAVWTPERHFHAFGGVYPAPSVVGGALAALTERVSIRAGSVVLPLQHPIRVAEEWSVVDNLSRGRVGLSFASGWHANDFVFAPERFERRRQVMLDGLDTVRRLWRGESIDARDGKGQALSVRIRPRPVQSELPVWLTAAGTKDTFVKAGELGVNVLTHLLGQEIEEVAAKIAAYRAAWKAHGHPGEGHVTLMVHTFVGASPEEVRALVRDPFIAYLRSSADLMQLARTVGRSGRGLEAAEIDEVLDAAFERYVDGNGLFGTPDSCLPFVERLRAIGVNEVACLIDFGVEDEAVLAALEHLDTLRRLANPEDTDVSVAEQIHRHTVTHLQCTPSLARALVTDPETAGALGRLRYLLVGGEALPPALATELRQHVGGELLNMYGPTETTIWSTMHAVGEEVGGSVPIGRPIANTRVYVVDRQRRPVPVGVPGELLIGGAGVARGYLHRPELTDERFIGDPFHPESGARVYRTGDLVRYRADGTIEFLGRADHQVKLRGHRIELPEIEALLEKHPAVRAAVVVAREGARGETVLVAYVIPAGLVCHPCPGEVQPAAGVECAEPTVAEPLSAEDLRATLAAQLPDVMVPSAFVFLDCFPTTPNGKVDRRALPAPAMLASPAAVEHVAPRTPLEEALAGVWARVLGVERVGVHDDFRALGGHSLAGLLVTSEAKRQGLDVRLRDFSKYHTVAEMAAAIESRSGAAPAGAPAAAAAGR
jgi:natural product biosynthesis luciferase-like monooxygenase protein/amino acid adenylation domain-containing protein